MVLPAPDKSFEQFQVDDVVCRQWAAQQIGMQPQQIANQNTMQGAAVGTVLGAGLGAAIGAAAGSPGTGAAIGAGSGLLLGTASGAEAGQMSGYEAQRRYDNAYQQCMYAKGNQIPGMTVTRTRRVQPPPPSGHPNPGATSPGIPPDYSGQ
jgi:thiamine pyrophosphate-dependent acetolactate synthase large subunit-like protein